MSSTFLSISQNFLVLTSLSCLLILCHITLQLTTKNADLYFCILKLNLWNLVQLNTELSTAKYDKRQKELYHSTIEFLNLCNEGDSEEY